MYRSQEWDDLEPGDIDDQGHEHPVRFLIVHKDTQGLTSYEKQNALRNLGIDKADTEHYGLVKYTDDWQYSGGGTEDFPLTLTRSAIVDLFMNTAIDARDSIAESAQRAEDAATSSANSSAIAQEAAEKAQLAYGSYARIMRVEPYLYDIWYDTLDYKYAYDYYSSADAGYGTGACSAVRNGNFFGRNYDWTYDNNAEFIVHTDAEDGRHAVLGTAASIPGLTDEFVRSGTSSILYKLVPFQLVDGINDAGLVINMNVVPRQDLDKEHYPDVELDRTTNKYIYPVGGQQNEKVRVSIMMLPRFVLDNFSRAQEAIGWLQQNATIYFPDKLLDMGYEIHCLLADKTNTRCIEFINGVINVVDINYITNFHVSGVQFNTSGKLVYTPIDASAETNPKYPTIENGIEKYGSGLERINIIDAGYTGANTLQGMKSIMESIYYSRAYSGNNWEEPTEQTRWYTEFVEVPIAQGSEILTTVDTNIADYAYALSVVDDRFIHRNRSVPGAWQTTHSIVYDIANLKSYIAVQEADRETVQYHVRTIDKVNIDIDPVPTHGSNNAVSSGGVYDALQDKQDVLASLNAGQNISIHDKGIAYGNPPEISAAGFEGYLDSSLEIGNGIGGQKASCLLGIGHPCSGGRLSVKDSAVPGSQYTLIAQLGPDIENKRTIQDLVDELNSKSVFNVNADASVYSDYFIKITHKVAGQVGNSFVYKADTQYWSGEPVPIQFPCFGMGEVQQGSLVPGRDAQTNYELTVNGDKVVLDKAPTAETLWHNAKVSVLLDRLPVSDPELIVTDLNDSMLFTAWWRNHTLTADNIDEFIQFVNDGDGISFKGEAHASIQDGHLIVELIGQYSGAYGNNVKLLANDTSTPYTNSAVFSGGIGGTSVLKHNHVYTIDGDVTYQQDWTVQPGATAEIYVDCTATAYNVNWPDSWIWGDSSVFKASQSVAAQPELKLGTETCVVVRNHNGRIIAHVEYIIDNN